MSNNVPVQKALTKVIRDGKARPMREKLLAPPLCTAPCASLGPAPGKGPICRGVPN